jgi:hypothetical protein
MRHFEIVSATNMPLKYRWFLAILQFNGCAKEHNCSLASSCVGRGCNLTERPHLA